MKIRIDVNSYNAQGQWRPATYIVSSALELFGRLMTNRNRGRISSVSIVSAKGDPRYTRTVAHMSVKGTGKYDTASQFKPGGLSDPDEVERVSAEVWEKVSTFSESVYDRSRNLQPRALSEHASNMYELRTVYKSK